MKAGVAEVPGPYSLVELFESSIKKHASRQLFGTKNRAGTAYDWITYGEVARRVADLRGGLASIGVGKGDGVAIIANNRVEWAVACYATYGRRARFIPMYEAELERIWKYIIDDSGSKVLIVSSREIYEKVKGFPDAIASLERIYVIDGGDDDTNTLAALERTGRDHPVSPEIPAGEDIAGLIYTSGTTGNPKGVLLSHRNLSSNVIALYHENPGDLGMEDRTLSFLPWAHSFGQVAELHLLVHAGASTGFAERPDTIVDDLLLVRPTMLVAVPRIFTKVYTGLQQKMEETGGLAQWLFNMGVAAAERRRKGNHSLLNRIQLGIADRIVFEKIRQKFGGRLNLAISSSAALNVRIAEFFTDIGIPVYEAWGMTELSPAHTVNMEGLDKPGSVGRPILGSWVEIDKTETGADSRDGEVIAYGPNVMQGYHNLPDKTAEVLRPDGGLRTGDRGWVDADGHLYITGRIKEQYKLENGKYVFPVGLEEAIKLSPYIENVMVEGANRPFNVALVVPDAVAMGAWAAGQGLPTDPAAWVMEPRVEAFILDEIRERCTGFAAYETPRKVLIVAEPFSTENGILTPTLKLKRRVLMERFGAQLEPLYE